MINSDPFLCGLRWVREGRGKGNGEEVPSCVSLRDDIDEIRGNERYRAERSQSEAGKNWPEASHPVMEDAVWNPLGREYQALLCVSAWVICGGQGWSQPVRTGRAGGGFQGATMSLHSKEPHSRA